MTPPTPSAQTVTADRDAALDEGIDFALEQLCQFLGIDPTDVSWDAATETTDGDVRAVIGNILRAKFGEDWGPNDSLTFSLAAAEARGKRLEEALRPFAKTGWMTGEIEHTARTIIAHMHPGREYETVLSSDDFKRARDLLAALSQTEEGR